MNLRALLLLLPLPGHTSPWAASAELSTSPYSEAAGEEEQLFRALALGAHGSYRIDRFGVGLGLELNFFRQQDLEGETDGLISLLMGAEGEVFMVGDHLRTRVGGGGALLLEGTELDTEVTLGFYFDLRPVGFRWAFDHFVLGLDPLSLLVLVPDPGGIPLVDVQYRINLALEIGG